MAAADLNAVMDGLGVRLATISGLRVSDFPADDVQPPAAVVGFPTDVDYDWTKGDGSHRLVLPVFVVVGERFARAARDALGLYLASTGAKSVKAAIEGDRTLAGACQTLEVTGAQTDGAGITVNGVPWTGAVFNVEVIT